MIRALALVACLCFGSAFCLWLIERHDDRTRTRAKADRRRDAEVRTQAAERSEQQRSVQPLHPYLQQLERDFYAPPVRKARP